MQISYTMVWYTHFTNSYFSLRMSLGFVLQE